MKKGLASLGISALAAAGFVGVSAPAYAANELNIAPSAGTVYGVTADESFDLRVSYAPGNSTSNKANLKLMIKPADATSLTSAWEVASSATLTAVDDRSDVDDDSAEIAAGDSAEAVAVTTSSGGIGFVGIAPAAAQTLTSYSVTVQAFEDSDGDGAITAGEWSSELQTVNFLKHSAVTFSVDIENPVRGASDLDVNVDSTNVNVAIMPNAAGGGSLTGSRFYVKFFTGTSSFAQVGSGALLEYDSATDKRLEVNVGSIASLAGDQSVKAEVFLYDGALQTTSGLSTATSNLSTAAALATRVEAVGTTTVSAIGEISVLPSDVSVNTATDTGKVKTGAGTFNVRSQVTYVSGYSSATVTYTIAENASNSLDSAGSITAGGKTLKNTNGASGTAVEFITVTVAADSDGYATLPITYAGLDNADVFKVTATVQGFTESNGNVITVDDSEPTNIYNIDAIGTDDSTYAAELVFPEDQAVTLNYALTDQYGALYTAGGAYTTVTDSAGKSSTASFVSGYAVVSMSKYDDPTSTTMTTVTELNGSAVVGTESTVEVTIGTQKSASSITALGDAGTASGVTVVLGLKAYANADVRKGADEPSVTSSSNSTITGLVRDADLNGIATDVTLSAPGVMFNHDNVWSIDSITVRSTATGTYGVEAYSNQKGAKTITVSSGNASATEVIYWRDPSTNAGTSLTVVGPDYVSAGSTLSLTATVTDDFGNPINTVSTTDTTNDAVDESGGDFKVTYDGPGLLVGSLPTETGTDGTAKVNYLLGQNDTGTITVVFSYDANGDLDYADTGDLTVTKTITIGEDPGETKVNAGSFKGYVAVYARGYEGQRLSAKIGNDWVIVDPIVNNQENGSLFRVTDFTGAGVDIAVRIYIDRVLIDTINLTTK